MKVSLIQIRCTCIKPLLPLVLLFLFNSNTSAQVKHGILGKINQLLAISVGVSSGDSITQQQFVDNGSFRVTGTFRWLSTEPLKMTWTYTEIPWTKMKSFKKEDMALKKHELLQYSLLFANKMPMSDGLLQISSDEILLHIDPEKEKEIEKLLTDLLKKSTQL